MRVLRRKPAEDGELVSQFQISLPLRWSPHVVGDPPKKCSGGRE